MTAPESFAIASIGVVIVSYRSPDRTAHFVNQELPKLPWKYRACVVDVAATPDTTRKLDEELPQETLRLHIAENLGYARGNNRGAELLRKECPDLKYLLICNDDILFHDPESLSALLNAMEEDPKRAVVGPNCLGTDGLPQSPWNSPDDLGKCEHWRKTPSPFGGTSRECYALRGCCLLIRAEAFFASGGFDEGFFLFFEEPALGERLARMGLVTWYEANAKITHLGSATIKRSLSSWRIYRIYRQSFFRMARTYWGWSRLKCILWPINHLLACIARAL